MVTGDDTGAMESLATEWDREKSLGFEMGEIECNIGEREGFSWLGCIFSCGSGMG